MTTRAFKNIVKAYYKKHRRDFPWRNTRNPYHILLSEVMLQQTQAPRVVAFYESFLKKFPTLKALSLAPLPDLLSSWKGLGYNRRALALQRSLRIIQTDFNGIIPKTVSELDSLPGIGENTAGAILAYAYGVGVPFIETNIRRAFIHSFFPRRRKVSDAEILPLVQKTLQGEDPREWYYALMDYGAMLGKTTKNANRRSRSYQKQSPFKGSHREARSHVLQLILREPQTFSSISKTLPITQTQILKVLFELERDGFIERANDYFRIPASG